MWSFAKLAFLFYVHYYYYQITALYSVHYRCFVPYVCFALRNIGMHYCFQMLVSLAAYMLYLSFNSTHTLPKANLL